MIAEGSEKRGPCFVISWGVSMLGYRIMKSPMTMDMPSLYNQDFIDFLWAYFLKRFVFEPMVLPRMAHINNLNHQPITYYVPWNI